jgi:hypothetical protein
VGDLLPALRESGFEDAQKVQAPFRVFGLPLLGLLRARSGSATEPDV